MAGGGGGDTGGGGGLGLGGGGGAWLPESINEKLKSEVWHSDEPADLTTHQVEFFQSS